MRLKTWEISTTTTFSQKRPPHRSVFIQIYLFLIFFLQQTCFCSGLRGACLVANEWGREVERGSTSYRFNIRSTTVEKQRIQTKRRVGNSINRLFKIIPLYSIYTHTHTHARTHTHTQSTVQLHTEEGGRGNSPSVWGCSFSPNAALWLVRPPPSTVFFCFLIFGGGGDTSRWRCGHVPWVWPCPLESTSWERSEVTQIKTEGQKYEEEIKTCETTRRLGSRRASSRLWTPPRTVRPRLLNKINCFFVRPKQPAAPRVSTPLRPLCPQSVSQILCRPSTNHTVWNQQDQ